MPNFGNIFFFPKAGALRFPIPLELPACVFFICVSRDIYSVMAIFIGAKTHASVAVRRPLFFFLFAF